jgi:GlcNAc-P-P-Und epimerase
MNDTGNSKRCAIIFGGSGFIGQHLIQHLIENGVWKIFNFDLAKGQISESDYIFNFCDVSKKIILDNNNYTNPVIFCLAAYFKHSDSVTSEYFRINVNAAKNICEYARDKKINTIVFLSTVECYGVSENTKNEKTEPEPNTPYGISKLIAEYIFKGWQAENPNRKLIILRPGVAYGKGEKGNFSKLYSTLRKKTLFFPGKKDLIKSVIYVKDLVSIMVQMVKKEKSGVSLFNVGISPNPTVKELCDEISNITGLPKARITIPKSILITMIFIVQVISLFIGKKFIQYNLAKVKKLFISTDIDSSKLIKHEYVAHYSLSESLLDWYNDCNKKGLY